MRGSSFTRLLMTDSSDSWTSRPNWCPPAAFLAVEHRTVRDSSGAQVTVEHFQRFVSPSKFDAGAPGRGCEGSYSVEGYGSAKHRQDDAYVARTVLVKR
jgi:hypothetical protein